MIRVLGFYRQKARYVINSAKMLLKEYDGEVPKSMKELNRFPGVGNKVAGGFLLPYQFKSIMEEIEK